MICKTLNKKEQQKAMNVNHLYNYGTINEVQAGVVVIGADGEVRPLAAQQPAAAEAPEAPAAPPAGRPGGRGDIRDLFADAARAEEQLTLMANLIRGHKGKRAALVVTCAAEAGWLTDLPSYEQLCSAFGDIGARSNFYRQMATRFTPAEKQLIMQQMKP